DGDDERINKAKAILKNAVIGLIIILMSFAIVSLILSKLLDATTGGGGVGSSPGSGGGGMGVIGECAIESVYPEPEQTEVARNTAIIVSFKEEINPTTIFDGNNNVIPENIRIFQTKQGDSCKTDCNDNITNVTASSTDNKTFVFTPKNYLGSPSEYIWYSVYLSNSILKTDDEPVFNACRSDYFEWKFEVSNKLDLTPPQVKESGVFPVPDNEQDDIGVITPAIQATGMIKVISQPNAYKQAKVISTIKNPASATWSNATTVINKNCSADGELQVSVDSNNANIISLSKTGNLLGAGTITENSVTFVYCNLTLTLDNGNFASGNLWTINVTAEQKANTLTVGNVTYVFGLEIAIGANNNATAQNIALALADNVDVTAVSAGNNVMITAKKAGQSGNKIDLLTNNLTALEIALMSNGTDKTESLTIKDKKDKPRNVVIQINFNEAINPLTVSGSSDEVKNYTRVVNQGNVLEGKFAVSNQYKTVEFISNNQCGVNGCGEKIYCLPENSNLKVELIAATLVDCGSDNCASKSPYNNCVSGHCKNADNENYPMANLDGIVDMASNSLDGDRSNDAEGPVDFYNENNSSGLGDNYKWSFFISDQIASDPPVIKAVNPIHNSAGADLTKLIEINFNTVMMSSSLKTGSVIMNNGKEDIEHKNINLWNFTNQSTGYWIAKKDIDDNPLDGEPDWTQAQIKHSMFADMTQYRSQVGSGVKDIYQNCFKPSSDDFGCEGNPSCCGGTATAGSECLNH
ncbi:Ig-like domain-containing protein, partial [Patescibacteria group bacterium]|nr:Ig-like domain-containing protein [Patescibacteria group bacterium]